MSKKPKTIPNFGKNPPHVSLENVIKYLDAAVKGGGTTGSFDDLTKAVNSTSIGSSAFLIRADTMKKFGVLRLDKAQKAYTIEPIGITITAGATPEQRQEAIRKVFLNNSVIKKIWDTFKGNIIPPKESLGINLASRLAEDIPEELKEKWANYFYDGAEYAGFFDKRTNGNYLKAVDPNPETISSIRQEPQEEEEKKNNTNNAIVKRNDNQQPTIFISSADTLNLSKTLSTGRILSIEFPEDPTPEEGAEIIKRFETGIKTVKANIKENGQI